MECIRRRRWIGNCLPDLPFGVQIIINIQGDFEDVIIYFFQTTKIQKKVVTYFTLNKIMA